MKDKAEMVKPDMEAHKTPDSWALEGAELAQKVVYRDGDLLSRCMFAHPPALCAGC